MAQELGSPTTGRCIIKSNSRRAWRAAVPPAFIALACMIVAWWSGLGVVSFGLGLAVLLTGIGRMSFWILCGDDSLWDDGTHLVYSRRGNVVRSIAWHDVIRVGISSGARFPELANWFASPMASPAVPEVIVWSKKAPASTLRIPEPPHRQWAGQFATLILLTRSDVRSAQHALAVACQVHQVTLAPIEGRPW